MTNGYFVIEEKGKIKNVVYLMSDSYLDNGYGEKIIRKTGIKIYGENISKFRFDG